MAKKTTAKASASSKSPGTVSGGKTQWKTDSSRSSTRASGGGGTSKLDRATVGAAVRGSTKTPK